MHFQRTHESKKNHWRYLKRIFQLNKNEENIKMYGMWLMAIFRQKFVALNACDRKGKRSQISLNILLKKVVQVQIKAKVNRIIRKKTEIDKI